MGGGLAEHKSDVPRRSGRCPSAVNGGSERADVAPPCLVQNVMCRGY